MSSDDQNNSKYSRLLLVIIVFARIEIYSQNRNIINYFLFFYKEENMLQVLVKKPPGLIQGLPDEAIEALLGQQFPVADDFELREHNRPDLVGECFAVDVNQVISLLEKLHLSKLAEYWRMYLSQHPSSYLPFRVDEVDLIY